MAMKIREHFHVKKIDMIDIGSRPNILMRYEWKL